MRRDRIGPPCRSEERRVGKECRPLTPSVTFYASEGQAVVCPLLRGRSPTRSVAPKQPRPRSPLLSPSTRARARPWSARCYGVARQRVRSRKTARGLRPCLDFRLSGSRVGAEESGAASFDLLVSAARCGATGSGRHAADRAGEPLHHAPPFTPSVTLYAREGQPVVCPLLRGRSPTRSVAPKQPRASGVLSLRRSQLGSAGTGV